MADEAALVEAARTDREAFGKLYDRYFDVIYNYIARRVGDEALAEDIAAMVWERALAAIGRYEMRGVPFAAWLYRIAGNLIVNQHRRTRLWNLVPFASYLAASHPFRRVELQTAVEAALSRLSISDQELIALYYYAGLNPEEVAQVLGVNVVAVHKRLHRARDRMKSALGGDPRAGN